jgi:hypothetical protein
VVFGAGKIGGDFNLSVSNGGWFCWVSKSNICWCQNSSWHCAILAVMLFRFSAIKVKTQKVGKTKVKIKGVHNKSFKPTALRAAA